MKIAVAAATVAALAPAAVSAFAPSSAAFVRQSSTSLNIGSDSNVDLSGNAWKPDSEKMGSTDTGDYYPEGYDPNAEIAFSSGMMGSQAMLNSDYDGPQLPGMENLGADAMVKGGIEMATDIPPGMDFTPSSVPDGQIDINVAASSSGTEMVINVDPICMTFEDFYAAFAPGSHPSFSVTPSTGRMDRRGGESTPMTIKCTPNGQAGSFTGDLVINLPEDNSKICFKVNANSF